MHLRIARPVTDLARSTALYTAGLGWQLISRFDEHDGFSGVMLGDPALPWHLELTVCHMHPVAPQPTADDLLVFYLPDHAEWLARCARMQAAGFRPTETLNPWWQRAGRSFADPDGYLFVLQNGPWR
jgi:catechol 2,3-dioxygenase-like lactoylglutathione lyase family enzyme